MDRDSMREALNSLSIQDLVCYLHDMSVANQGLEVAISSIKEEIRHETEGRGLVATR